MDTIFVSIGAFDEPFVGFTVEHAYAMANSPKRIFFGISEQRVDDRFYRPTHSNVKVLNEISDGATGSGINRGRAYSLYDGQKYMLNIDAHMYFNHGWDDMLVSSFTNGANGLGNMSVMTNHLPQARAAGNKLELVNGFGKSAPMTYVIDKFMGHRVATKEESSCGYGTHYGFSGHNSFSLAQNIIDFPFDPEIFFFGEEQALALRYSTHGYTLFSPCEVECFAAHLEKAGKRTSYDKKSINAADDYNKIKSIMVGNYFGPWGAPDEKSRQEFYRLSGFNPRKFLYLE